MNNIYNQNIRTLLLYYQVMENLRNYLPPSEIDCVVYHNPCSDGFAGAYTFWKYIKETRSLSNDDINECVRFIPYSHLMSEKNIRENMLPQITNRNVVFIDVCPNEKTFVEMLTLPKKSIVLDHHESGLKTTEKFDEHFVYSHCFIDQRHSGCMLAHQYCYPNTVAPLFLACIEDRDIWAWKIEDISRPFTEAFHRSIPYDFEAYSVFEDEGNVYSLVEEGKLLMKYRDSRILELVTKASEGEITINDKTYAVYIINTTEHISDLGHILAQTECSRLDRSCDFALIWYYDQRTGKIKVSLRSDGDRAKHDQINVSEIARYFGGGGHPNASGFSIEQPDLFLNALNSINGDKKVTFKHANSKRKNLISLDNWYVKVAAAITLAGIGFGIGQFK